MKQKITYLLIVLALIACNNSPIKEVVKESYPNGKVKYVEYLQEINGKEQIVEERAFFDNGKFKMGGKLKDGKREGVWLANFYNGKVQSEGEYKAGIKTGETKVYYDNGNLMYEGRYKADKKVGVWKFYNKTGKLVNEQRFN